MYRQRLLCVLLIACIFSTAYSQKLSPKTYPSLLWEITGNGLKKPSYLFGTMHVSSKMVFHLPDSFYYAIKNVDAVALELNPDVWQGEMVRLDQLQLNYKNFIQPAGNDYLHTQSFQLENYEDQLKLALRSEPTAVNSLLYRTYQSREDFEEDTFLDLYIFQTGKKLGKRATGVEDYYQTEKIVLEAYSDMAKDKNKKIPDTDGASASEIGQKMQEAYRRGDLDILDSLDKAMEQSQAFRDKFLYKRNEIQANSIDTILKRSSLFVGVGAAHLAGDRGVIELLRKKGYKLRPVLMADRDASQKDEIDKLKVPVKFITNKVDDGFYKVDMPGPLFKMADDNSGLDRRQYADMSNGTYYVVTRIQTHAAFIGYSERTMLKKVDSLLYENIPGKIISKTSITKNGYPGFDITNRTRRGDIQRYQILITPFELLVFKMSGKENYVKGEEADKFFSSIQLKESATGWVNFQPSQGGFKVSLPEQPHQFLNTSGLDGIDRWEYEAVDKNTGDVYLVLKKSVNNFHFLEEDTFDLGLIEESFKASDFISKELQRKMSSFNGYPCMDVQLATTDNSFIKAKILIKGSQYYLLAAKSKSATNGFSNFFSSFQLTPFKYQPDKAFTDTFFNYKVVTPVAPDLEESFRALIEKITKDNSGTFGISSLSYWPKIKTAVFKSDSTGEEVGISMQQYPKYYSVKDSSLFWNDAINDYTAKNDFILTAKDSFKLGANAMGYQMILRDTNSSRIIKRLLILKDDIMYRIVSLGDTVSAESDFIKSFFTKFIPEQYSGTIHNIFANNIDAFFKDFFSTDSATHAKAQAAISNIYYSKNDVSKLYNAINRLQYGDKDYFDNKSRFIAELGYIRDGAVTKQVVQSLKDIYYKTADTSIFQNKVLEALAKHRSKEAYDLLKELVLQDPPVFENDYEYSTFFSDIQDSLQLAKQLFPEILQLASIDDYKENINSLLVTLIDSNVITAKDYESYFTKIYFDAKVELKKQVTKDEKQMVQDKDGEGSFNFSNYSGSSGTGDIDDYAVLLMPFYNSKPAVQKFFEKLLYSKDAAVRSSIAVLMFKNNKNVPDSILVTIAADDKYRSKLYKQMQDANLTNKFPAKYKDQVDMARSVLISDKSSDKIDSIVYLKKQLVTYRYKKGYVYFFKYRIKKESDWKIGISGLQPEKLNEVSADKKFAKMTDKRIKPDVELDEQLDQQLKKILFAARKSGKNFYDGEGYDRYKKTDDD